MPNSNKSSNFKISKTPPDYFRLTIVILAAAAVGFLIYFAVVFTLFYYEELALLRPFQVSKEASLELKTPQMEYQVGETINVKVLLKTELKETQGVDILLKYNPENLALLTVDSQKEDFSKKPAPVRVDSSKYLNIQESAFDIFPYFSIDIKEGLISFSALAKPLQEIEGDVEVGSLNFQAVKTGETSLDFVFEKGKTADTNVAFSGRDILGKVRDLKIIIK